MTVMSQEIRDKFSFRQDWKRPKRWWCRLFDHYGVFRWFTLGFHFKTTDSQWEHEERPQRVFYCERCKTVLAADVKIDLGQIHAEKITGVQVYEHDSFYM